MNDQQLASLRKALRWRGATVEATGPDQVSLSTVVDGGASLDLSPLAEHAGTVAHVHLTLNSRRVGGPQPIVVRNLADNIDLSIVSQIAQPLRLSEIKSSVYLERTETLLHIDQLEARDLLVGSDASVATPLNCRTEIILRGGTILVRGRLQSLVFEGGFIDADSDAAISLITVRGDQELQLSKNPPQISTIRGEHFSRVSDAKLSLVNTTKDSRATTRLQVQQMVRDLRVDLGEKTALVVSDTAVNLKVTGAGALHFAKNANGYAVELDRGVALTCSENSSIMDLSGDVRLGGCAGAHLEGARGKGFTILGKVDGSTEADWSGSILIGFQTPPGLAGRRLLADLEGAYHLNPNASNISGWDQALTTNLSPVTWMYYLQSFRADRFQPARQNAEYLRELSRLAREKGAPGATRTKLGWCANRLRNQTADGVEWIALSFYRLIGYGERPLPALVTWLIAALLSTWVALSTTNASDFNETFGSMSLGPLAGIMRVDGSGAHVDGTGWLALRALVAIPLVTGLIALRNYVKS